MPDSFVSQCNFASIPLEAKVNKVINEKVETEQISKANLFKMDVPEMESCPMVETHAQKFSKGE